MMELLLAKLQELGADVSYDVRRGDLVAVTVLDFEGFGCGGEELYRDYDEDAIDDFCDWLEEECARHYGDFYQYYEFDGFVVQVGYESYEI